MHCLRKFWKTAANNSLICYPAIPKDGLYAVGESCRDVMSSARIPKFLWRGGETLRIEPWALSDSPEACPSFTMRVSVELAGKTVGLGEWRTGPLPANENRHGDAFALRLPECPAGQLTVRVSCMENCGMDSAYHLLYRPHDAPQADPAEVWRPLERS
jgi:beta-mannosidase